MFDWFAATLKQYPEIAIFLTLAIGYYFGKFTFKGIGLGSVTATLLAGVVIGQIGITINQPLKATVFLMFLFAVGYGVGPQFVRGVAKDGLPQAHLLGGPMRALPDRPRRDREVRGLRPRVRGRTLFGVADDLRRDGPVHRRDQPAGPDRRSDQGADRLDADRLRGDLHVRHDGLGGGDRRPRPQAARHQSRSRVQGLRAEAGRRQGTGRPRHGLAALGSARLSRRGGRQGGGPERESRPRRSSPTLASSCCASVTTARSRKRRRTPCCTRATWSQWPAPARCSWRCSARTRPKSRIGSCWRCRSRASTCW